MSPVVQTLLNTFKIGDYFFNEHIFTLDEESARRTPIENGNNVLWLAGHLLNSRWHLLGLFGEQPELPWLDKFRNAFDTSAEYPSMKQLEEKWQAVSQALFPCLEKAADADMERAIDWNIPNEDKTVRGALLFYTYHEAWHLGQIATLRRSMGMPGLVSF